MIRTMNGISGMVVALMLITQGAVYGGVMWNEVGDAGDSLATANITMGGSALMSITGTLSDQDPSGVDLFKLSIPDPSQFSASTDNFPNTDLLDTWLYLFDETGLGIAGSASTLGGSINASIAMGTVTAPPGMYYLAVTRFEAIPQSGSGAIFPDLFLVSIDGEVLGATGPGGASPLSSWSFTPLFDNENYRIDLTGANPAVNTTTIIPEPTAATIWMVAAGIAGIRLRRRR